MPLRVGPVGYDGRREAPVLGRLGAIVVFVGCGCVGERAGSAADPAADRVAFRDLACERIGDRSLRDECVIYGVRAAPGSAEAACPTVVSDVMRDECWFTAVDAHERVGRDAVHECARAGRFVSQCHANAISREVSALPPLPEGALTTEVERILATFRRPPGQARDLVRRRIAAVGEGAPVGLGQGADPGSDTPD